MNTSRKARDSYNEFDDYQVVLECAGYNVPQRTVGRLTPLLRGGERILDVGCGTGLFGNALWNSGWRGMLIGIDIAEKRLRSVALKRSYAQCIQGNAYQLPFPNSSFDVVASTAMVGLTGKKSVRAMWRLVKPGGYLVCAAGEIKYLNWCRKRFRQAASVLESLPGATPVLSEDLGGGYNTSSEEHYVLYVLKREEPM